MEPVTPKTMFLAVLIRAAARGLFFALVLNPSRRLTPGGSPAGRLCPTPAHFFRFQNAPHAPQVLRDRRADDEVIEMLPLCNLLARHAHTVPDDFFGVRAALAETLFENGDGRRGQKDGDE